MVLPEELWGQAAEEQERARQADPWEDSVRAWLEKQPAVEFTTSTVLFSALGVTIDRQGRAEAIRVGKILKRFGFNRVQMRIGNIRNYIYRKN